MKQQRCATCLYWDRKTAEDAAGRVRSNRVARCQWSITIALPDSLRSFGNGLRAATYMAATDGSTCSCYRERTSNGKDTFR